MIRKCMECDWYTVIETAQGRHIAICADENGGCFLQETSVLGWCGEEEDTQERILPISEEKLDHYRKRMQANDLALKASESCEHSRLESWSVSFDEEYSCLLEVYFDEEGNLWCDAVLLQDEEECCRAEARKDLLGLWSLLYDDKQFVVNVVESDTKREVTKTLRITKKELDRYREMMQVKRLALGKRGLYTELLSALDCHRRRSSTIKSWSVDFGGGYAIDLKVCSSGLTDPLWCEAVLFLNGCECGCTDVEDDLLGDWELQDGDNRFILKVMEGSEDGIA